MIGRIYIPKKHNSIVAEVWEVLAEDKEPILTHVIPPLGSPELIFYIGDEQQIKNIDIKNAFIKEQYTLPQKIEFNPNYHIFGIRLQPYGLKQLFY